MSSSRQEEDPWRIDTVSFAVTDRVEWEEHRHDDHHEILWGSKGALTAETDHGCFAIPSMLGLWIPAGTMHRVTAAAGTSFRCTYIDRPLPAPADRTIAVALPEVIRALLDRLSAPPFLAVDARRHGEALMMSLLEPVETTTVDLPMPRDDRTRRVARAILSDPNDSRTIDEWGRDVGSSARNLSRLFTVETGLSFAAWRTRARMRRAIELLAADYSVVSVSRRIGYASPSAFVQAFRREVGRTPGEFANVRSHAERILA